MTNLKEETDGKAVEKSDWSSSNYQIAVWVYQML